MTISALFKSRCVPSYSLLSSSTWPHMGSLVKASEFLPGKRAQKHLTEIQWRSIQRGEWRQRAYT